MVFVWSAAIGLLSAAVLLTRSAPTADVVLTARMHHLRLGDAREWAAFPAEAEGSALVLRFDASANAQERTLRLRHRDLRATWRVQVNGREIARLPPDDADTISYRAIPPGTLRDGANELRIDATGTMPDDVFVGSITLIDRPRPEVLTEATIDVAVLEAPAGRPVPSRITVTDEEGALVTLGIQSDATRAVRPGTVYSRTGSARLMLPAGRYVLYAGRGFEYGVDRAVVDVAKGQTASQRLTIRRDVDTAGWAAMDTHIHTGTFARHGDATTEERLLTLAGEGIELPVSTEHGARVDFEARARTAQVRTWFTPILGTEVTTPTLGHFNVFPLLPDAPDIDSRPADWTALRQSIEAAARRPAIVLNHGRDEHGGFRPLGAARHIGIAGEDLEGRLLPANAMEVLNSGAVMSDALALTRDWMGLLNRGQLLTPAGASDSHDVTRFIVGQGRTYVRVEDRRPDAIDTTRAMDAFRRGQVMVSYGLLTEIDVDGRGPASRSRRGATSPSASASKGPRGRPRRRSRCT